MASKQDKANTVLPLATWAGKMGPTAPSGGSRPADKGGRRVGAGHPDSKLKGGGGPVSKKMFLALRSSFWSKREGGRAPPLHPPLAPAQHYWNWSTKKLPFWSYKKSHIGKLVPARWLDIGLVLFCVLIIICLKLNYQLIITLVFPSSQSINMQERTWPVSGHLDLMLGLFSKLHGQTSRFLVWANDKQNSGLVNFILKSCLPFVQISSIYLKMATKAWKWYQICFEEKNINFRLAHSIWKEKDYLFRRSITPGNFPMERSKK